MFSEFSNDNDIPTWKTGRWLVQIVDGTITAHEHGLALAPDPAIDDRIMRDVVDKIINGDNKYERELTEVILAAEQYRKDNL